MGVLLLVLLVVAVLAAWKGTGRNHGTVAQQHVDHRRPFEH